MYPFAANWINIFSKVGYTLYTFVQELKSLNEVWTDDYIKKLLVFLLLSDRSVDFPSDFLSNRRATTKPALLDLNFFQEQTDLLDLWDYLLQTCRQGRQ